MVELHIKELYDLFTCPLKYKLKHIDHLDTIKSDPNETIKHAAYETLNRMFQDLQDGKPVSLDELKRTYSSLLNRRGIHPVMDDNPKQRERELEVFQGIHNLFRMMQYQPDKIIAVNVKFRLSFGKDFFVTGEIPLIRESGGIMEIINFKTGKYYTDEFLHRTNMLFTMQAIAYQSIYKKPVDRIGIYFLRKGKFTFTKRTTSDYKRLYKKINVLKQYIKHGWYVPHESLACSGCEMKEICKEWSG